MKSLSEAAFLDRLETHRGIPRKVAGAYCRNRADREDCVQEIVAQLWRSYPRYDAEKPFSTWAWRIAVNVAISFYRKGRDAFERTVLSESAALEAVPAAADEPDAMLERLYALVARLDEFDRALVVLYLDDRPQTEIADVLGITVTNVSTKLGRIKARMKQWSEHGPR